MKTILPALLAVLLLPGCLGTAKLSDFSQTAASVDFEKLSKEFKLAETPFWTASTSNEYYFEKETIPAEELLVDFIKASLAVYHYNITVINPAEKCIIGQRGMMANEWASITAVYYKTEGNRLQVYIKTKITQDFTGGWKENRAMKVGKLIEQKLQQ
ncbi:MAG: hypothetical protein JNM14_00725 [Ferruginibacter sp.]|nr:hypothetical protein [Ferruginibacter sp.]